MDVMRYPRVSIVIPAHNAEKSIVRTLRAFQGQTLGDFEVIVCNDRSTDGTNAAVSAFCSDPRFAVYDAPGKGAGAARNFGLGKAKGEYVVFFDADDVVDADFLMAFVSAMEQYDADIAISACRQEDEAHHILYEGKSFGNGLVDKEVIARASILSGINLFSTTIAFRRSMLAENDVVFLENVSSFEDIPFWFEAILTANRICFIPTSHAAYIQHPHQSTRLPEVIEEEFRSEMIALSSMQQRLAAAEQAGRISKEAAKELQMMLANVCVPHAFVKQLEFLLRASREENYRALLHSAMGAQVIRSGLTRLFFRHRHESWFKILSLKYCKGIFESYYRKKK